LASRRAGITHGRIGLSGVDIQRHKSAARCFTGIGLLPLGALHCGVNIAPDLQGVGPLRPVFLWPRQLDGWHGIADACPLPLAAPVPI
jgi:hypothetical protein